MKKYFLIIVFIAIGINTKAQISVEHVYDSASTIDDGPYKESQLVYINTEINGEKYLNINKTGKYISIYNLNHSLINVINYEGYPQDCSELPTILYFSDNLFDDDSLMEFMYIWGDCNGIVHTRIYKEDGTYIFSADSSGPLVAINVQQLQYPIFNTSQGTKMILSHQFNGKAILYNLPGILTSEISEVNNNLVAMQTKSNVSNPYPNPTDNSTQIDYTLPDGINEGEIIFYDLMGNEVKRFKVDRTFSTLLISTADIAAGTYYYQLQTTAENSEGKKMVIVK